MIPDIEVVICGHLRDHALVNAIGAHVGTKSPPTHVDPWVRVTLLDAPSKGGGERLVSAFLQADCFAGNTAIDLQEGLGEARDLARAVRTALIDLMGQVSGDVIFSRVQIVGFARADNTGASEPARDGYSVSAEIAHHG